MTNCIAICQTETLIMNLVLLYRNVILIWSIIQLSVVSKTEGPTCHYVIDLCHLHILEIVLFLKRFKSRITYKISSPPLKIGSLTLTCKAAMRIFEKFEELVSTFNFLCLLNVIFMLLLAPGNCEALDQQYVRVIVANVSFTFF